MTNDVTEKRDGSRLRSALPLMVGLSLLGDVGVVLSVAGVPIALVLCVILVFAMVSTIGAVLFSARDEPAKRLVNLIKAVRRR